MFSPALMDEINFSLFQLYLLCLILKVPQTHLKCLKVAVSRDFRPNIFSKMEPSGSGSLINRIKWFCLKICFPVDIRSSKNSTPLSVTYTVWSRNFFTSQPYKMLTTNVGLGCNSSNIFSKKFKILNQGKQRPAKTKMPLAKLRAVLYFVQ